MSRQVVNLCEIHALDIVQVAIILYLSSYPVDAFNAKDLAFLDGRDERNVGVTGIV